MEPHLSDVTFSVHTQVDTPFETSQAPQCGEEQQQQLPPQQGAESQGAILGSRSTQDSSATETVSQCWADFPLWASQLEVGASCDSHTSTSMGCGTNLWSCLVVSPF